MTAKLARTWDDARMKRDRLQLLQTEMRERGIGALYLNDSVHQRYVLNVKMPGGGVFVPPRGGAIAFVRPRDTGYVKLGHDDVRPPIYNRSALRDGANPEETRRFAAN